LIFYESINIRRGQVCLAALDPVLGSEISKTRPVVIISNDKNNEFAGTVTVLPITSKNLKRRYPFEVFLSKGTANLPKNSKVKADQIRTLDKSRIVKFIGELTAQDITRVETAVKIHLDLYLNPHNPSIAETLGEWNSPETGIRWKNEG
jgi:mRNA interferase MazF